MTKKILILAMAVLTAGLFAGCTEDDDEFDPSKSGYLEMVTVMATPGQSLVTRADPDPEPEWQLYEQLYPLSSADGANIYMCMLESASATATAASGKFSMKKKGDDFTWTSNVRVTDGQLYYAYGFLADSYTSCKVSPLNSGTYGTDGAQMEIDGLNVVSASDVSVVVGTWRPYKDVTAYTNDATTINNIIQNPTNLPEKSPVDPSGPTSALGYHSYTAESGNHYIYMWLDHLYSCVNFELYVAEGYSRLRKIYLNSVQMKVNGSKYNVKVNVLNSPDSDDKYLSQVSAQTAGDEKPVDVTVFNNETGVEIPALKTGVTVKPLAIPGYFAPGQMRACDAVFRYTVVSQGKDGITTRNKVTVTNHIPATIFGTASDGTTPKTLVTGNVYTIKATIEPTYLYQLADDDLDNPTVHITTP